MLTKIRSPAKSNGKRGAMSTVSPDLINSGSGIENPHSADADSVIEFLETSLANGPSKARWRRHNAARDPNSVALNDCARQGPDFRARSGATIYVRSTPHSRQRRRLWRTSGLSFLRFFSRCSKWSIFWYRAVNALTEWAPNCSKPNGSHFLSQQFRSP